jgi:hypothetical protein
MEYGSVRSRTTLSFTQKASEETPRRFMQMAFLQEVETSNPRPVRRFENGQRLRRYMIALRLNLGRRFRVRTLASGPLSTRLTPFDLLLGLSLVHCKTPLPANIPSFAAVQDGNASASTRWGTSAATRAPCRPTSGTETSSMRFATPSYLRRDAISGAQRPPTELTLG